MSLYPGAVPDAIALLRARMDSDELFTGEMVDYLTEHGTFAGMSKLVSGFASLSMILTSLFASREDVTPEEVLGQIALLVAVADLPDVDVA